MQRIDAYATPTKSNRSERQRAWTRIILALLLLAGIVVWALLINADNLKVNLEGRNTAPSLAHLFGTDWLGRDMFARTLKGLTLSLAVGMLAALSSTGIALFFSLLSSWNKWLDDMVTWVTDLFLSIPHIVTLILLSVAVGGGFKGVVVGLALTHWPRFTRLLRAEVLQVKEAEYVGVSRQLGRSRLWIARHHFLPHLFPHLLVGFLLLLPHAILHEAAITFLGFGFSTDTPAIGVILSESMSYLSTGLWWLAFFPGLALVIMVSIFELLGRSIRRLAETSSG
ncbi:ABC transporter permease [Bacillus piscicola]|uniref:ABC transporter permease n=1 Tax=Bacillus piscicola TaxID=1632684 RepID=UPI0023DDAED4|nr:ABC transporter permease [Bacillus piscicola]